MKTKLLKATLLITGALFALAGVVIFLPEGWMRGLAGRFVEPETLAALWPSAPAVDYMLRASMVAYLWAGVTMLLAGANPEKYRTLIHLAIAMLLLLGATTFWAGQANGLPLWWYLGDSLFSIVVALLLVAFRPGGAPL